MIKYLLKRIAFRILDSELRKNWIHRSHFISYTDWLSRDFPVMKDMQNHFKDRPYGENSASRHREEMSKKYKPMEKHIIDGIQNES